MGSGVEQQAVPSRKKEAWKLFSCGQTEKAKAVGDEIVAAGFADAEVTYLIGCCQARMGQLASAVISFNLSLEFQPELPYTHVSLGAAYNAMGNRKRAIACYEHALTIQPDLPEANYVLADLYCATGNTDRAEAIYKKLIGLKTGSGVPYFKLAHIEKSRNRPLQAIEHFEQALKFEPENTDYLTALGDICVNLEMYERAIQVLERALQKDSLNETALGRLCIACVRKGDYQQAVDNIDIALANGLIIANVAIAFLSVCKHVQRCEQAIDYAQSCLKTGRLSDYAKNTIHGQLALTLDHCERYDEAWHHLSISKKGRLAANAATPYDPAGHCAFVNALIDVFNSATLFQLPKANVQHRVKPVFIVGMPRSGTSLVEHILNAHPQLTGGGELSYIGDIINRLPSLIGNGEAWPGCIRSVKQPLLNRLATEHLDKLAAISATSTFISDKMPHNYYALGLIQLLFPDAKIIHCRRNPLDTCISIYFQNFLVGHDYSDSLFNLGTHYHQYQKLMQHWKSNLGIDMLELDYEELVNKPEDLIRKLVAFCGLPWDEQCLAFNKQKRRVSTASFDQVRQPIYTRSIDRWRYYDVQLDELKLGLERGI